MNYELMFSAAGVLAMIGWVMLLASPWMPLWSDRMAGIVIPTILSGGYIALSVLFPAESGGFGTFEKVSLLFSQPQALLAGWVHFLTFDLIVGAWICRTARNVGLHFWLVAPCLPVTFLFGPAGFLLFTVIRWGHSTLRSAQVQIVV